MAQQLKDLVEGQTAKILEVAVIKELKSNVVLVADSSKVVALFISEDNPDCAKLLKTGAAIKVIKPTVKENNPLVMQQNPLFPALIPSKAQPLKSWKIGEKHIQPLLEVSTKYIEGKEMGGVANKTNLVEINAMQTGKDEVIQLPLYLMVTSAGPVTYTAKKKAKIQFLTVMDSFSNKTAMMLFHHHGKMKPFHIYRVTKVLQILSFLLI